MPCASDPVFRPAGRLCAMTECQRHRHGLSRPHHPIRSCANPDCCGRNAGRHCGGGSDGPLLIGAGTDDGHASAALIEIEARRIALACVYAHAVEAVQGRTAWARQSATLRRRRDSSRRSRARRHPRQGTGLSRDRRAPAGNRLRAAAGLAGHVRVVDDHSVQCNKSDKVRISIAMNLRQVARRPGLDKGPNRQ